METQLHAAHANDWDTLRLESRFNISTESAVVCWKLEHTFCCRDPHGKKEYGKLGFARVGWTPAHPSRAKLGDTPGSFAYGSTGTLIEANHCGQKPSYCIDNLVFREGDVITTIVQPAADGNVIAAFLVNSKIAMVKRNMKFAPNALYVPAASARMAQISANQIDDATKQAILDSFNKASDDAFNEPSHELRTIGFDIKNRVCPTGSASYEQVDWKRVFQQRMKQKMLSDNPHAILALLDFAAMQADNPAAAHVLRRRFEVGFMVEDTKLDRVTEIFHEIDNPQDANTLRVEIHVIYTMHRQQGAPVIRRVVWDRLSGFVDADTEALVMQNFSVPYLQSVLNCDRLYTFVMTSKRACQSQGRCYSCRGIHVNSFDDFIKVFKWDLRKRLTEVSPSSTRSARMW